MTTGTLFLIPVPLGPAAAEDCLPPDTLAAARRLEHFVAERAKTARAHLKAMGHPRPLQELSIAELNEHTRTGDIPALLAPLKAGKDVGLMSEAGCPAVADPGAELVRAAHRDNIAVVPLIGPSSLAAFVISVAYGTFRSGDLPLFLKEVGLFALGVAATFVPLAIYVLWVAGVRDTYFSLIESPAEIHPVYRSLPFPEVDVSTLLRHPDRVQKLLVYFPFVILSVAALEFVSSRVTARGRPRTEASLGDRKRNARIAVLLAGMDALFCLKGAVRPEVAHFAPAIIVSLVLSGYLMWQRSWKSLAPWLVVMGFFFAVPSVKATGRYFRNAPAVVSACLDPALPRLACVPADEKTVLAAKFLERELPQVKDLYVGAGRHDSIFVGNVAAYFVVPKRPATKWHELHPGIQTRADIQQEIISELSCSESLVVILDRRWDHEGEGTSPGQPPGSKDLDRFISEEFVVVQELGDMTILTRIRNDDSGKTPFRCSRKATR